MSSATLLLLADGRLPSGGHAHSGGLEAAAAAGLVGHPDGLAAWLWGRLQTVGLVDAAFAAASAVALDDLGLLDDELAARTPSAATRRASRAQGRGLLRTARVCWPSPTLEALWRDRPEGVLHPVAFGVTAATAGLTATDAALAAATNSVTGPAWAATRLTGMDPALVAAVLARLASAIDAIAAAAVAGDHSPAGLPALSAPLLDLAAEEHATWEVRLFAS